MRHQMAFGGGAISPQVARHMQTFGGGAISPEVAKHIHSKHERTTGAEPISLYTNRRAWNRCWIAN